MFTYFFSICVFYDWICIVTFQLKTIQNKMQAHFTWFTDDLLNQREFMWIDKLVLCTELFSPCVFFCPFWTWPDTDVWKERKLKALELAHSWMLTKREKISGQSGQNKTKANISPLQNYNFLILHFLKLNLYNQNSYFICPINFWLPTITR